MARRRRPRWWVYAIVLAIPVAITASRFAIASSGKSYEFSRVAIDATVLPDGSLRLREQRTFDFKGEFSFAFFTVAWPFDRIQDFSIHEGGRPVEAAIENEGTFRARWEFRAEDEQGTFTITYRALCAVRVSEDAAHLLWQFIGTGWEVPTREVLIRVHVPEPAIRRVERTSSTSTPGSPVSGTPMRSVARRSAIFRRTELRARFTATAVTHAFGDTIPPRRSPRSHARASASWTASSAAGRLPETSATAATTRG